MTWQKLMISGKKLLISAELKECVTWFICFLYHFKVLCKCGKFHHCEICVTDFRKRGFFRHSFWSWEKPLIGRVVLAAYGNKILNTAKPLLDDKKVTCNINNCLIHTILLVIICLLIPVVVFISCFFYLQNIDQNKNNYYHFTKATIN